MGYAIKGEGSVPVDAVRVKVTNIKNPYHIRLYDVDNHAFRANAIRKKLEIYAQKNINFDYQVNELLNLNDSLIVSNSANSDIPGWYCRGILGEINENQMTYNVFLPDYGISFNLKQSEFRKIPKDVVPDEYLSETVALNVIPTSVAKNNKLKEKIIVNGVEEWTESAICLTKELVGAAERLFFQPEVCNEKGKLFGELYLDIEGEIVLLSRALILSLFAVKLHKVLLKNVYEPNFADKDAVRKINDSLLINQSNMDDEACKPILKERVKNFEDSSTPIDTGTEDEKQSQNSDSSGAVKKPNNLFRKHDQEILIRSQHDCKPLKNIADARFPLNIHKVLKSQNINRPMKIQTYMWPAIAQGLDVISISPVNAGKTFGYLVPIASYLATQKLATGRVPTTLVLCASSSDVATTASLFQEILEYFPRIKVVAALNGKSEKTLAAQICNGCQVLVSTAPFLVRFLIKYRSNSIINIDLTRLRHLILDGGDVILDKYMDSVREIIRIRELMCQKHELSDSDTSLQMIAVGRQWTKGLSYFKEKHTVYPFVCIGSYMEAAAFAKVQANLCLVKHNERHDKFLKTVGKVDTNTERTMILCTSVEDAIELNDLLHAKGKRTLLAHNDMLFNAVHEIKYQWTASVSGTYPILICTDEVLPDMDIKDAKCLIHYSIDVASRSKFYYRFSTIRANWHITSSRCKIFMMVNYDNDRQFKGLIEIMQRFHATLPAKWLRGAKKIAQNLDKKKRAYPVCDNLKALGFCPKDANCSYRHCFLNPEDAPKVDVAIGDKVELMVTYIHNASHFSARLVKCYKKDKKEPIVYPSDVKLSNEMQKYFSIVENRKALKIINVGDICAMEDTIDNYLRVRIVNIVRKNDYDEPSVVTVKFIDYQSDLVNVKTTQLMHIPENLGQWQSHSFDVFLTGLEAVDKEYEWDQCANNAVTDWFKEFFTAKCTVLSKVDLLLENTIWVNTLEIRTKIIGYPEFSVSSLRKHLIENNHAVQNKEHLPALYNLCKSGGISTLKSDEPINKHDQVD